MSTIEVHPVRTSRQHRTFLTFPWRIYRDDPLWVPPLIPQRADTIDPERGAFFQRGTADLFIARRGGEPVGTICAGEDEVANQARQERTCVFGFFECVDDDAVAAALFERVIEWAHERDLDTLYGPFNLDYEDSHGVLVEGRDRPPTLLCGHTPLYYPDLLEGFGFEKARPDSVAYAIAVDEETSDRQRMRRLADKLRQRGHVTIRGADIACWQDEVDHVHKLLNSALAHMPDHIPWTRESVQCLLEPFLRIADPDLVLFSEVDGEVVGWLAGVPNLNEIFIDVNGLRYPWDYVRLWWHMGRQPRCLAIKSVLVLPDHWGTGASLLLFDEMDRRARAKGYQWFDLSLTGAENPHTNVLARRMGGEIYKRYRVYRLRI